MSWTIKKQKTGFQEWHGHSQAGGWSNRGHFYVTRVIHSNGYVWWKLSDRHIAEFMDALDELGRSPSGEPL